VYIDDDTREATVVVPDDQLALAIGKEGLNARLAARLTGWKVDIKSDTEFAQAEAQAAFAGEDESQDFSGRCSAILTNGKRCPNTALPSSHYCGVPAHQELALADPDGSLARAALAAAAAQAEEEGLSFDDDQPETADADGSAPADESASEAPSDTA
jgi:transcription termination/antitermination protein NusA